jgi:hypothetical protein
MWIEINDEIAFLPAAVLGYRDAACRYISALPMREIGRNVSGRRPPRPIDRPGHRTWDFERGFRVGR